MRGALKALLRANPVPADVLPVGVALHEVLVTVVKHFGKDTLRRVRASPTNADHAVAAMGELVDALREMLELGDIKARPHVLVEEDVSSLSQLAAFVSPVHALSRAIVDAKDASTLKGLQESVNVALRIMLDTFGWDMASTYVTLEWVGVKLKDGQPVPPEHVTPDFAVARSLYALDERFYLDLGMRHH